MVLHTNVTPLGRRGVCLLSSLLASQLPDLQDPRQTCCVPVPVTYTVIAVTFYCCVQDS